MFPPHGEKSRDIRSRNLSVMLYLATVVEHKHRFVISYLGRTRNFISRPLWKNITDPMLFKHESRDFEALSHAPLSRYTRQPGSKVKVGGRSLSSRVSSSMLEKHRFRDFKALRHQWIKITDNEKRNHAGSGIFSCVSSRSKVAHFRGRECLQSFLRAAKRNIFLLYRLNFINISAYSTFMCQQWKHTLNVKLSFI